MQLEDLLKFFSCKSLVDALQVVQLKLSRLADYMETRQIDLMALNRNKNTKCKNKNRFVFQVLNK